ncbi:SDR family oxidoreductase [Pseudaminobacter arsenicus]|uniref:SDR family oxidoreductase n=1 Tax=Borborobacter arsenicus TaxID=1851146 RepID=A0A432V4A9_9HYPH|nr:SDR family NAD(P)-dependent oxidoreductase [Pseudaminobacter arsenicus]RUM96989.1 SDR family oxidoreductase [Pseudaminobacter arsenicus]
MSAHELEGRVAIVTGASRNIGRSIAVALGEGGAHVLVHAQQDRDSAEQTARDVEAAGGRAAVVLGDLADPAVPARMVESALSAFGKLDIVVANAAIRPEASIDELTYADWRKVMALCLDSVFLLAQAALKPLRLSDQASIVTIGGLTGHSGAANRPHVIAAKAGLVGLTKALAHDLGKDAITVNCVAPGLIETKRAGADPKHHASRTNVLGHHGTPQDVAAMARMLAGPAMRYVTGQTIHVNGGALMV